MGQGTEVDVYNTTSGPISGKLFRIDGNRTVRGFLGVPYAQPPVGELRFKKPEPVKPWIQTRECREFGPRCPQTDEIEDPENPSKDEANCLTLNVFAPTWKRAGNSGFPVMIWIHGGGFVMHSSANYGSDNIAKNLCGKDVIVVSINYRLGIFGFLRTGEECKGNFGMWDQTLALRWVKDNASLFGGDPNKITLFGQSAGGASVDLLGLSPHSRDLFQRVIPMAGCADNFFATKTPSEQEKIAGEYAKFIGWDGEASKSGLLNFYQKKTSEELELGINGKPGFNSPTDLYFTPNLDGDFFPKSIAELRAEAPVKDVLTGIATHEGLFFAGVSPLSRNLEGLQKLISKHVPKTWANFEQIREKVLQFYLKGKDDQEAIEMAMVEIIGDRLINQGLFDAAAARHEKGERVHLYRSDHFNPESFGIFEPLMPFLSSTHSTELIYVFGKSIFGPFDMDEQDLQMIEVMTKYFTNFAKTGNPNSDGLAAWQPIDNDFRLNLLAINTVTEMQHAAELEERWKFWTELANQNEQSASKL